MKQFDPMYADLRLFDGALNVNTSEAAGLSPENKTYYDKELIRLADPELIHQQFGQRRPIPKNGGKTIDFRQFNPLPEMLTPLEEGVTPDGQSMSVSNMTSTVKQYGGYVAYSDVVDLTAIDPAVLEITKGIASQAGRSLDTVVREVLCGGTVVQFASGQVSSREKLYYTDAQNNCNLTVDAVKRAVRYLKNQNAPLIDGSYVGIIHPDCTYDLMNDPEWRSPHEYCDPANLYTGEIGMLYGVRFVENTRAKVFKGADLASDSRTLTLSAAAEGVTQVSFSGGAVAPGALEGRLVLIGGTPAKVTANTDSTLTLDTAVTAASGDTVYPGEGGAAGAAVYATLILGDDAYGVTEVTGGGLEHILKPVGSAGTADPLNQRGTIGWKALLTAERLVEQYMVRIESTATP